MHFPLKVQKAKKENIRFNFCKNVFPSKPPSLLGAQHLTLIASIQYGDRDGGKPVATVAISIQVFVRHLRITTDTKFELIHDVVEKERQNGTI